MDEIARPDWSPTAMPTGSARSPRTAIRRPAQDILYPAALAAGAQKWPGGVARAFNTTRMLDRIAPKHGRKLNETRHRLQVHCDLMLEHEILIGGEESGGIGYTRNCRNAMAC